MSSFKITLWPITPPGSEHLAMREEVITELEEHSVTRPNRARSCVSCPRLEGYIPEKPNGTAILIAPGGGYQRIVFDKEGEEPARALNQLGITVFVLTYRLPAEGHQQGHLAPLQDAQRAIRLIRDRAKEFHINPARIGIMGFSAGGHVAASLMTRYDEKVYVQNDQADMQSARPDFSVLIYPVITMEKEHAHAGSLLALLGQNPSQQAIMAASCEHAVTPDCPLTFIALADDDASVPAENAVRFYLALRRAKVPTQMHIYQKGGHGFGLRLKNQPVGRWTQCCEDWLRENHWI